MPDLFYDAKFDENGNVREGWNYEAWVTWWWSEVAKFSTSNCNTVTRRING